MEIKEIFSSKKGKLLEAENEKFSTERDSWMFAIEENVFTV